jgi:ABC-type lipoprotein export system ATPase subunit
MKIDLTLTTDISRSIRVQQLESMFECPATEKLTTRITGDLPIESRDWNIGLIVGPSGSGKTQTLNTLFGEPEKLEWSSEAVIDNFPRELSMQEVTNACKSVGFNTIPAWMRQYRTLSNGERFRSELARRLLGSGNPITIDEFTSVVDRQVAQIAANGVSRFVRGRGVRLVAASCHYDIIDWLQPDWLFEPATQTFTWRLLRGRPKVECEITRVKYETWKLFAPYHYMSAELHRAARCYGLFVNGRITTFSGILYRPHPRTKNVYGMSRAVTLPDWQGLGLFMALTDTLGAAYSSLGNRLHMYPNHPSFIRTCQRSVNWLAVKEAGSFSPRAGNTSSVSGFGGSRCAVFEYIGPSMNEVDAKRLIEG